MKLLPHQKTSLPEDAKGKTWFLVDVKGKTLGRTATALSNLLRGKGKVSWSPQQDSGDHLVVINAREIRLAKNKTETKLYHWHTGYGSGLKTRTASQLLQKKPEKILFDAVWGMLPRNKLRRHMMKKLHIFPGADHRHTSQSPEPLEL